MQVYNRSHWTGIFERDNYRNIEKLFNRPNMDNT